MQGWTSVPAPCHRSCPLLRLASPVSRSPPLLPSFPSRPLTFPPSPHAEVGPRKTPPCLCSASLIRKRSVKVISLLCFTVDTSFLTSAMLYSCPRAPPPFRSGQRQNWQALAERWQGWRLAPLHGALQQSACLGLPLLSGMNTCGMLGAGRVQWMLISASNLYSNIRRSSRLLIPTLIYGGVPFKNTVLVHTCHSGLLPHQGLVLPSQAFPSLC